MFDFLSKDETFKDFDQKFSFDSEDTGRMCKDQALMSLPTYVKFAKEHAGGTFNGGLYRFYDSAEMPLMQALAETAFKNIGCDFRVFASDWLGRQYALNFTHENFNEPSLLILDVSVEKPLFLKDTFENFHNKDLKENASLFLEVNLYKSWVTLHDDKPLQSVFNCVGLKSPFFLGGVRDLENLNLTDFEAYWTNITKLREDTFR